MHGQTVVDSIERTLAKSQTNKNMDIITDDMLRHKVAEASNKPNKNQRATATPATGARQCPFWLKGHCRDPKNCTLGGHDPAQKGKGKPDDGGKGGKGSGGKGADSRAPRLPSASPANPKNSGCVVQATWPDGRVEDRRVAGST